MGGLRMTFATAMVLQGLAKGLRHGFDIVDLTGIRGGTVYPILRRLEGMGLVASEWEDVEISREEGRPARRYYRLREEAGPLVADAQRRFPLTDQLWQAWEATS